MIHSVNRPITVGLLIREGKRPPQPQWVRWEQRTYRVEEVGFHHTVRRGMRRVHAFSLNVGSLDMRVEIDGDSLAAILTEVSDGLAD